MSATEMREFLRTLPIGGRCDLYKEIGLVKLTLSLYMQIGTKLDQADGVFWSENQLVELACGVGEETT